jgi:hypothetical protein
MSKGKEAGHAKTIRENGDNVKIKHPIGLLSVK